MIWKIRVPCSERRSDFRKQLACPVEWQVRLDLVTTASRLLLENHQKINLGDVETRWNHCWHTICKRLSYMMAQHIMLRHSVLGRDMLKRQSRHQAPRRQADAPLQHRRAGATCSWKGLSCTREVNRQSPRLINHGRPGEELSPMAARSHCEGEADMQPPRCILHCPAPAAGTIWECCLFWHAICRFWGKTEEPTVRRLRSEQSGARRPGGGTAGDGDDAQPSCKINTCRHATLGSLEL